LVLQGDWQVQVCQEHDGRLGADGRVG